MATSVNGDAAHAMESLLQRLSISEPQHHGDANIDLNPNDVFRCYITDELARITGKDPEMIYPALAWTNTLDKGDLMLAVPRIAREKGSNPAELGAKWCEEFPENRLVQPPKMLDKSMRFDFKPEIVASIAIPSIQTLGNKFGYDPKPGLKDPKDPASGKKKTIIEFSSPNVAKEFHVGHLRSTIIGQFLSNLYEAMGWDVFRMNYLGDWGRQYGTLAVGWERYGNEEAFKTDPIRHLYDVYTKISADLKPETEAYDAAKKAGGDTESLENQGLLGQSKEYFKRMEASDPEALATWRRFRELSIERYKETYGRLNLAFDEYNGESNVKHESMERAERILEERGVVEYNKGAKIIDFKKQGQKSLDVAIVRNRNGTSNYMLRDIGSAIQRWEQYGIDHVIYVIMMEQDVHVKRFFKTLELMGDPYTTWAKKMQHVTFGKILGMSTRRGNVKFLGESLDEIRDNMHDVMRKNEDKYKQVDEPEKIADILGISSIMVQDMSGKRINNYKFEMDRMTSFEGDTGPYLQYAHARLSSILRKTEYTLEQLQSADLSLLTEAHATGLARLLMSWPDTVSQTYKTLEPSTIVTYLFRLTHQLSSSYDHLRIVGAAEGPAVSLARAALYHSVRQVLRNGLVLLGLTPVDRM